LLTEAKQEEGKEKLILSAFIGWQMGAGAGKKFGEYLEDLGLSDKKTPQETKLTAKEAIAKAERIKAAIAKKRDEEKGKA